MVRKETENKIYKFMAPAVCIIIAVAFFVTLSFFLQDYRLGVYDRIIASNILALQETTDTLISKTTEGFEHCRHEVRLLGVGMSETLKERGFSSVDELEEKDRKYLREFTEASVFDYCVLLNEAGRGIYSGREGMSSINLYSSQAYVDCISSAQGEAISFISDPLSAAGKDVVAFSSRAGSVILIGVYSQESFEALYDSATFGEHASYLITTDTGLILSSANVTREVQEAINLFTYLKEDKNNEAFFREDELGNTAYDRTLQDFRSEMSGSAELYFQGTLYEMVYAPVPQTGWSFISCVSYDYIIADAAEINQKTLQLTFFIILLLLGLFLVIVIMLVFVLRARASREAVRRDRIFTLMTRYVPNVIIIADSESGSIEYVSRNSDQVLGIKNAFANIIDDRFLQCVMPQDRPGVMRLIHSVRTGTSSSGSLTFRFTRPDTLEDIILILKGYLIAEEDSSQHFIALTLENITESVYSRRRLEEALENEERANAAKSTFLASMSHDIRTPLNAVIGLTTLALQQSSDSRKVEDCLHKIISSSQLLLGLINDVLDMSKIESGNMELADTEFELWDWLDGVLTVIRPQAGAREQHFSVKTGNISHEFLRGDTVRLSQVLTNVLGNAVKFTPEKGEIRLDIEEIASPDPERARFLFKVSDNGIGMSEEYQGHIFDMFSRDQSAGGKGIQGTGLGMAITKRIVDLMNGTISVESAQGKGTVFTIELPLRLSSVKTAKGNGAAGGAREAGLKDMPDGAKEKTDGLKGALDGMRILMAEDNAINREIAKEMLESVLGAHVDTAWNGQEACERFENTPENTYDILLMDLQMPVLGGLDAARRIRGGRHPQAAGIPIIALTANAFEEDHRAALEAGMNGFVSKPVDFAALVKEINRVRQKCASGKGRI